MIKKLLEAAYAYYVKNSPIMSDAEYDALFAKCQELEKDLPDKVTDKVCLGYFEGGANRPKIKHIIPMLSLEKDNDRVAFPVVQTPKFDGVAIECVYDKGKLLQILTRGDGYYGSDITKHRINNIPTTIPVNDLRIVRGEVMCDTWEGKTHRNYVAGKLNALEVEDVGLYMIAYFINTGGKDYIEDLGILDKWGFKIPPYRTYFEPAPYDFSPMTDLPTDGFVFRYLKGTYDYTSHHYKGHWAWKPEAVEVPTTIIEVDWTQSKNNVWTPVAIIDPVTIDGTEISRVNLASLSYIMEKDICIGDTVLVRKAKEIIPEIVRVIEKPPHRMPIEIETCPKCGATLETSGIYLKCPTPNCAIVKQLEFFCKELNIKGLGSKNLAKLGVTSPIALYTMTKDEYVKKLGFIGNSIYAEVQKSIKSPLSSLLSALNPPLVKQTTLKKLFKDLTSVDDLGDKEKLMNIKGMGEKKAIALSEWFKSIDLKPYIVIGFSPSIVEETISTTKKIAVTGTFSMTRKEFEVLMQSYGVQISSSLTKSCSLLVYGDKPSQNKVEQAKEYGIPIVHYTKFLKDLKTDLEQNS